MSFDNLMKKYGVKGKASDASQSPPPKRQSHNFQGNAVTSSPAQPSIEQLSNNQFRSPSVSEYPDHQHTDTDSTAVHHTSFSSQSINFSSGTTYDERPIETTDYSWSDAGSFGSNDNISDYDNGFGSSTQHHHNPPPRLRQWPWTDIICIVLIIVEAIALLANLDALFYAILPFVSNLLLLLLIGGAVVLALYFRFGRRGRW